MLILIYCEKKILFWLILADKLMQSRVGYSFPIRFGRLTTPMLHTTQHWPTVHGGIHHREAQRWKRGIVLAQLQCGKKKKVLKPSVTLEIK